MRLPWVVTSCWLFQQPAGTGRLGSRVLEPAAELEGTLLSRTAHTDGRRTRMIVVETLLRAARAAQNQASSAAEVIWELKLKSI